MSELPESGARRRPRRWLLRHRLGRASWWLASVGLGLAVLSVIRPPSGAAARGSAVDPEERLPERSEPWRQWRERLAGAHVARRAGDVSGALALYDAVASAPRARGQDAEHAALWAARLRLGLGECSAALALHSLVLGCEDPALLARAMVEARSHAAGARCAEWSSTLRGTAALARKKLSALAVQETGEGARARRWLHAVRETRR